MEFYMGKEGEELKHINCRSIPVIYEWYELPIDYFMTDDEKIDYHESKRIFDLYGVEENGG